MIQITQRGLSVTPNAVDTLRRDFERTGCAYMPGFLAPAILFPLLKQVGLAGFEVTTERGRTANLATTQRMLPNEPALLTLLFTLNQQSLFECVRQVANTPALANFVGRIHRVNGGANEHIDWHDDALDNRSIAINLSLSSADYSGGLFQIRGPDGQIKSEIKHKKPGDAFLFRIGRGWSHRVTAVESGQRTVAVGWFRTSPEWQTIFPSAFRSGILDLSEEGGR